MGSSGDGEFTRLVVDEMGGGVQQMGSSRDGGVQEIGFSIWGVYEMVSSADGKFMR